MRELVDTLLARGANAEAEQLFVEVRATDVRRISTTSPSTDVDSLNSQAWDLANAPFPALRNPTAAVALATRAVQLRPTDQYVRNTLGVARYRAGDFNQAIADLHESIKLGGSATDSIFLAMAHHQAGHTDLARAWYVLSSQWLNEQPDFTAGGFRSFRAEAAKLLELPEQWPTKDWLPPEKDLRAFGEIRSAVPGSPADKLLSTFLP